MITADGRAVLVDFGLAAQEEATPITMSGMQPGSLPYMSPEQLRGERGLDPRTDIYSLGVSLYEMLALRRPFQGDTVEEVRAKILHGHPPALRSLNRQVAWDVETVCLTAMEPDRSRRYASAGGFARDLENLLRLRPIGARRASLPLRIRRASQRRPVPALVLAVIVLALAGLAVAHGWRRTRDRANVEQLLHEARALEGEGRLEEAIERTGGALAVDAVHPEAVALRDRLQSISRERAAHDLTEIRRLADSKLLRDLKVEADGLWPARPERASSFEGWLKRAQDLRGRLNGHRGALEALEPEGQTAADIATQWQRDVLRELVSGLEGLAVLVDEVRSGLETARTIAPLTVSGDSARKMWAETAADVASLPIYGGLRLEPQIGLLPIGRDPRSGLWEFHHPETGSCPERQGPGDMPLIGPDTGIIFVLLPGGNAQCGSWPVSPEHPEGTPHADPWHRRSEAPVHEVRLEPFFLAKHEMTQGQWFRATGRQPSVRRTFGASPMAAFPVENVAWAECVRVLARFELLVPTEIQWEYACRAGTATVFSTGDSIESLIGSANVRDDTLPRTADGSPADGFIEVAPVGRLHPNRWGLHDMHGNLWEWCRKSSDDFVSHYRDHAPAPGDGWRPVKATGFRICRGGSFDDPVRFARSAVRSEYREDASSIEIGVRPLLPLRR
jgi:formylglycine-generating enzyme required for sulfatase activity